jgi:arabinogalactan endo-1,4-beta-galactosidase
MLNRDGRLTLLIALLLTVTSALSQQPTEPVDITPLNGETYYILNQLSGLQMDLDENSVVQQTRSFSDLRQRWVFTQLSAGVWQIRSIGSGLCVDSPVCRPVRSGQGDLRSFSASCYVVQNPCTGADSEQWTLAPVSNGYYTITNRSTGRVMDVSESSTTAGTRLVQSALGRVPTQGQQWLPRPVFFRGVDNALLEKQEAARLAGGMAWWEDAGQQQDLLQMFKNHGVNLLRLRPSSEPPYANISQTGCSGNACYGEAEAQDLDLARRAKNLGMSIELTLLFDGGSSASVPPAWTGDTLLSQLQSAVYAYVKAEILSYREAGVMPDLVAIGNEVDTGFLGSIGSPTGEAFGGFATLQIEAMQAVKDAAADTASGPAIPPPLTCIHITPAWNLSQFFALANQFNIPYDAICQSYYPLYHGPLTDAQAAASNPNHQPVEQDVLMDAVNNLGKPIFIIETGEHFENGFDSNDPWYAPPSEAQQRQFLLDLQAVLKGLPNNLGMGMEYWDPSGVNITNPSGGLFNGDNLPDAIYIWNGLTLFDDTSSLLPGMDALGGKLDPTLSYKFINLGNGQILAAGSPIDTQPDSGSPAANQQWRITSNDDGYFQIATLAAGNDVLEGSGTAIVLSPAGSGPQWEWNVVSAGNGYFHFVNRASGMVLDLSGGVTVEASPAGNQPTQEWQIVAAP